MTKPLKIFSRSGLWQTLKNIQVRAKNNFVNVENFAIMTGIIIRFETLEGTGGKKNRLRVDSNHQPFRVLIDTR